MQPLDLKTDFRTVFPFGNFYSQYTIAQIGSEAFRIQCRKNTANLIQPPVVFPVFASIALQGANPVLSLLNGFAFRLSAGKSGKGKSVKAEIR